MTDNLAIWSALAKTDPKHTKQFTRSGGFKGTATRPIYHVERMTETFGPCGTGWGFSEPTFQIVNGADGEVAVYCWLTLWYVNPATGKEVKPIPGVGGDFVVKKVKDRLVTDDEAFKKAATDAEGNAMKALGMSADIHMGLFDNSKYVSDLRREFDDDAPGAPVQQQQLAPARQQAPKQQPAGDGVDNRLRAGGNTSEEFGRSVVALINSAPDDDVIVRIGRTNHNGIAKLAKDAPDRHRDIMAAITRAETNLRGQAT
jgi:hypothetical protein